MFLQKLKSNLSNTKWFKKTLFIFIVLFLASYVFCIPSFGEREDILRYTIYASMALLAGSSLLYCFLYSDFKINRYSFFIPAFAVFGLIGTVFFSHDFRSWITLVLLAISFYIFIYSFKAINNKFIIINVISIALFFFSAYYIFKYRNEILNFRSFGNKGFRIVTVFDNQNGVAAYSIVGLSLSLYVIFFAKPKIRFLHLISVGSFTVVGITTGSRTFIILYVIVLLLFIYFRFKKQKLLFFAILILLVILGFVFINLPFMATLKTRFISVIGTFFGNGNTKTDTAALERVLWMDYAFALGERNLLTGYGCNGFPIISGVGTYSHSNFSEVLCNFGLIGFILFYSPLFICLFKSLSLKNNEKIFVITFFVYYFIASFTNVIYYKKMYYLVLSLIFYLCFFRNEGAQQTKLLSKFEKVMFTCDTMGCGGAERVISVLANGFNNKGIEVSILGIGDTKKPNSYYELNDNVKYLTLGCKKFHSISKLCKIRRIIKKERPDLVISFLPVANIYTCFALIGTGIPYVVSERNDPRKDPKSKVIRFLKKYAFSCSDGAVFQTREAMTFYSKKVQNKSVIIHNPLIIDLNNDLRTKIREKNIISVGRLSQQKNYKMLLDAFEVFYKDFRQDYELHIYGDGAQKDELVSYANLLKSKNNIIFKGNDNDWQSKEINSSLYVLSSDYEGMPNSLLEAVALGIPSISTDCPCGGPHEILKPIALVPVGNYVALAEKMIYFIENGIQLSDKEIDEFRIAHSSEHIVNSWLNFIGGLKNE